MDGTDLTIIRDEAMEVTMMCCMCILNVVCSLFLNSLCIELLQVIQYNIPAECGFASGFILGVRVR